MTSTPGGGVGQDDVDACIAIPMTPSTVSVDLPERGSGRGWPSPAALAWVGATGAGALALAAPLFVLATGANTTLVPPGS